MVDITWKKLAMLAAVGMVAFKLYLMTVNYEPINWQDLPIVEILLGLVHVV